MLQVDEEAIMRARKALRKSRIRELRELAVEQCGDAVALHGRVSSFYHKQLAQELVRNAVNGTEIMNHLQVIHPLPS